MAQGERQRGGSRLVIVLGLLVVTSCGALRVDVVGESMAPTLKNGDSAVATRTFTDLVRGDIVGFKYPKDESKNFVQRIIGQPGDRIEMKEGRVIVDDRPLEEPYVADANRSQDSWGPVTVPHQIRRSRLSGMSLGSISLLRLGDFVCSAGHYFGPQP